MIGSLIDFDPVFFETISCASGLILAILMELLEPPHEPNMASLTDGVSLFNVLSDDNYDHGELTRPALLIPVRKKEIRSPGLLYPILPFVSMGGSHK